ncbi:hypothetical protein [Streptomyces canus]|uniref:hypothetical protein n=1 Tax=Streptomyces canus TaxID=58343 RepID=UPI00386E2D21|nr:hypothetical protein OH837_00010 [Streptomyces canus]WSZ55064.1 hypothetical protein OH824_00015 [Streptomyces canus]WSZ63846.1 hypothetical protein OH824_48805 [Streptomyces canus]
MPSKRRTKPAISTRNHGNVTQDHALTASWDPASKTPSSSTWPRVALPVPPTSSIPTVTAVGGGSGLAAAIITGHIQPGIIWPAVTLAVAGMAYDIAVRALNRPRRV